MRAFETTSHIGPDGKLSVTLPPALHNTDVRVTVEPAARASRNGGSSAHTPPSEATRESRRRILDEVLGTIDDPTFVRPPQGDWPEREPLD
jgi:hypothetical protein